MAFRVGCASILISATFVYCRRLTAGAWRGRSTKFKCLSLRIVRDQTTTRWRPKADYLARLQNHPPSTSHRGCRSTAYAYRQSISFMRSSSLNASVLILIHAHTSRNNDQPDQEQRSNDPERKRGVPALACVGRVSKSSPSPPKAAFPGEG